MQNEERSRHTRQKEIVPCEIAKKKTFAVIGVGAVGRQVALQLAAIGVGNLILVDPDTVDIENVSVQGYALSDIGKNKVDALKEDITHYFDDDTSVRAYPCLVEELNSSLFNGCDMHAGVDVMTSREYIYKLSCSEDIKYLSDARLLAETTRYMAIDPQNETDREYYESTLFSDEEAFTPRCTSKSTIYAACATAAFVLSQYTKYLRELPYICDCTFVLRTNELVDNYQHYLNERREADVQEIPM